MRLEREGRQSDEEWVKDLMVELFFPAWQIGFTLAVGGERAGGVAVLGHVIGQEKGKQALSLSAPPSTADVRIEGNWEKTPPSLKVGQSYDVRVRRVKDLLTFYINGKRVARVRHAQLDGDMEVRVAAPEARVSLGKVAELELPRSYRTPDEEPVLGEFGYVVGVDGQQAIVDSDMEGIALNRKVSVMAIDKVVKGEKSKTIFLRKIASGTVVEVGPRTSQILCVEEGGAVARGMKILPGSLPAAVTFTDARIEDLDEGL